MTTPCDSPAHVITPEVGLGAAANFLLRAHSEKRRAAGRMGSVFLSKATQMRCCCAALDSAVVASCTLMLRNVVPADHALHHNRVDVSGIPTMSSLVPRPAGSSLAA